MRIVFLGPPGAGKGTQAQRLKDHLRICHLSTGEMLRDAGEAGTEFGAEAVRYMNAGRLVPDEVVVGIVGERLQDTDCLLGCLFDGFPRTVQQAEALDRMLSNRKMPLNLVLALDVSEPELLKRLGARGRPDDTDEAVHERFIQYYRLTRPLLQYYRDQGILRQIDAEGTPEEVFGRVRAAVGA